MTREGVDFQGNVGLFLHNILRDLRNRFFDFFQMCL